MAAVTSSTFPSSHSDGSEERGLVHAVIEDADGDVIGFAVRLDSHGVLDLGVLHEVFHIVAAIVAQHDGHRDAMVQV